MYKKDMLSIIATQYLCFGFMLLSGTENVLTTYSKGSTVLYINSNIPVCFYTLWFILLLYLLQLIHMWL